MAEENKDKSNKFGSRKFIVWIAATVLELGAIALAFVIKDGSLAQQFTPWWGGISLTYLGCNVGQRFVQQKTDAKTEAQNE